MKKINWIFFTILTILAITGLIILTSSTSANSKGETPTYCKEKREGCDLKNRENGSGELIMDNMSRQFISINPM